MTPQTYQNVSSMYKGLHKTYQVFVRWNHIKGCTIKKFTCRFRVDLDIIYFQRGNEKLVCLIQKSKYLSNLHKAYQVFVLWTQIHGDTLKKSVCPFGPDFLPIVKPNVSKLEPKVRSLHLFHPQCGRWHESRKERIFFSFVKVFFQGCLLDKYKVTLKWKSE